MSRRGVLKNIAYGLLGTFVSRNNDIDGYWGPGILRRFAVSNGLTTVTIDLSNRTLFDKGSPIRVSEEIYQRWLQIALKKRGIAIDLIDKAQIDIRFSTYDELPKTIRDTRGEPYVCTVTIVALHKTVSVSTIRVCEAHDPKKERRSTRADQPYM